MVGIRATFLARAAPRTGSAAFPPQHASIRFRMKNTSHRPVRGTAAALSWIPLLALALGACTDRQPLIDARDTAPGRNVESQPSTWRGHWNSPLELWVYDKTPEVGMNSHLHRWELLDTHYGQTRNAGMRLVRHTLYWQLADPEGDGIYDTAPGSYLYAWRHKVNRAQAAGVQLIAVVHGMQFDLAKPVPWQAATSQADFDRRFSGFLRDMTAQFPEVKLWQVWNEMDAGSWGSPWNRFAGPTWTEMGQGYATTLAAVYPVIKADPSRWVVLGGLTGQNLDFARGMYDRLRTRGQPYPFDIMALHGYGVWPHEGDGVFAKVHSLTPIMNAASDVNRPIWATEAGTGGGEYVFRYGWPTGDVGAAFDESQRAYWASLAQDVYATPVTKVIGYNLYTDAGAPPSDLPDGRPAKDYDLSLLRGDAVTPRPAYNWLAARAATTEAAWNHAPVTGTFRISTGGQVPAAHPYYYASNGDIIIQNVQVNTLTPTVIPMKWPTTTEPDPEPCPIGMKTCEPT